MSTEIKFTKATPADAARLAPLMREDDRNEILAMGEPVERAIKFAIEMSTGDAWLITFDGEPAAIFGVVSCSLLTGYAVPWLLTTPVVDRHRKTFFKLSRDVIFKLRRKYALLGNHIDARYAKSIKWAQRLGFKVGDARPYGPNRAMFCQVIMEGV